jgi:hypothetical protein
MVIANGSEIFSNLEYPVAHLSSEEDEEKDTEPRIEEAYLCYGEDQRHLTTDDSRHYADLSLHIITKNYNNGDTVSVNLNLGNGDSSQNKVSAKHKFSGIVYDNKAVIENVFKEDFVNL